MRFRRRVLVRQRYSVWSQPSSRWKTAAMHQRSCGTVSAGVHIFSPPGFLRQEPGGDERQGLMMMPATPGSNLVVRQARFSLGTLQALLDAMLRVEDAGKLRQRRLGTGAREGITCLNVPSASFSRNTTKTSSGPVRRRSVFADTRLFMASTI